MTNEVSVVTQVYNLSTWDAKAEDSQITGQCGLPRKNSSNRKKIEGTVQRIE